jgi:hypothetical protein
VVAAQADRRLALKFLGFNGTVAEVDVKVISHDAATLF